MQGTFNIEKSLAKICWLRSLQFHLFKITRKSTRKLLRSECRIWYRLGWNGEKAVDLLDIEKCFNATAF